LGAVITGCQHVRKLLMELWSLYLPWYRSGWRKKVSRWS